MPSSDTAAGAVRLVDFSELTPQQLDGLLAIYREAFEAPWEWPAEQVAALATPTGCAAARCRALALLDAGRSVGLAISQYLPVGNLWYLHYLAVEGGRRNSGFGSTMLEGILPLGEEMARAAGRPGCLGTLIEVEQVDGPPSDADRVQRRRRIAFYERHGAQLVGLGVPRPPRAPPEMPDWEVMLVPGLAWNGRPDGAARRHLCRSLMVEGYGRAPDEPWLVTYLDTL
jgi:GNAT superfamily N-acetyltransferase